ncbi:L-proline dehydrogenase /delta-1-pyrroline-5-carboxylate dehydrogenase [Dongia mobilis]|uniref:Bifunctional protein PutA n=2 Tax=Dongia mobilis TaxID=578943 RepID=A0A4R6WJ50_9PROT|nr:bifunctional proline dehydrogenase/L-glutamate gamma-semialdehyde dehydrogenase PutA [Dongia mobilis]TDQ78843.1 L-proline dehydrogenase /delta-1-pyrroline-5-carboxylate dehydrogenase [Dongia mobilis]
MTMIFCAPAAEPTPLRRRLRGHYRADETAIVEMLLGQAELAPDMQDRIAARARRLVEEVRKNRVGQGGIDAFMHAYELSSKEGVVLMCLAEALLRIPDSDTANQLIRDKLKEADFGAHLGESDSLFVNASTWALMLTGRIMQLDQSANDLKGVLKRLVTRSGEPVIRQAVTQAMKILGRQFVMGRDIGEALERAEALEKKGYRYSYDMLGEAARTMEDAERYFKAYVAAIKSIGKAARGKGPVAAPGISIKLSALHPRYEFAQSERVMGEMVPKVVALAEAAKTAGIGCTIDAEEADRLDLSLDIIEVVAGVPSLAGWDGLGLAIQAYQKRCLPLIDWLADCARRNRRRLMVRLVKGAYWDSEVKWSQERGLANYPVFTRKASTDVSYLACARRLLADGQAFYPMFATHNAHTLSAVIEMAGGEAAARDKLEFQRLHGMGEPLYNQVTPADAMGIPCRIYAPVGSHEDLLAYLVRRLLENGANTSFVNRIVDEKAPLDAIVADPIAQVRALKSKPHPGIPLPSHMFGAERRNSAGVDLSDPEAMLALAGEIEAAAAGRPQAGPIIGGQLRSGEAMEVKNPADTHETVGSVVLSTAADVEDAVGRAARAFADWSGMRAEARAACLDRAADLMEQRRGEIIALCIREAGKTIGDAVAELREAVDFCRYYAARARTDFAAPQALPGPTGERNQLYLHGRGVFVCISPWNFPLAIFMGQVSAALVAGNCVIAKPAEQTPLIASLAVRLLHQAGVPGDVLHLLPGDGPGVGAPLTRDPRIAGIAFTGSTETARLINRTLAAKDGPIVPLIAETGGQNAMIVDSTALPEQVVRDVLISSFQSAGQRCSALRVLFVQQDIGVKLEKMLAGAMAELKIGNPAWLQTDIGPVIDAEAKAMLETHAQRMEREGKLVYRNKLGAECAGGHFFAPAAYRIDNLNRLQREVFGPVLHVIHYAADRLDEVLAAVNGTGYGLTLGIHSRIDGKIAYIAERLRVGNAYVNRNMIGAVVGVQPFGGEGLSGTGPKAGGPRYLHRFATERTLTIDTTAAGGNASLLSLTEEGA